MTVIWKIGRKQDNFDKNHQLFFFQDPHQASDVGVADRQIGCSLFRIRDTRSTRFSEQTRNIHCLQTVKDRFNYSRKSVF